MGRFNLGDIVCINTEKWLQDKVGIVVEVYTPEGKTTREQGDYRREQYKVFYDNKAQWFFHVELSHVK